MAVSTRASRRSSIGSPTSCTSHAAAMPAMPRRWPTWSGRASRRNAHRAHPSVRRSRRLRSATSCRRTAVLAADIEKQCRALRDVAEARGGTVTSAKPHGALYHAAHADPADCAGLHEGIVVRWASDHRRTPQRRARSRSTPHRHEYLREAFADRGVRADGSLVPRGEPGAILEDPLPLPSAHASSRRRTRDTLCIHADTPTSLAIARAVRAALDEDA